MYKFSMTNGVAAIDMDRKNEIWLPNLKERLQCALLVVRLGSCKI